jgi:hypothetical protein
MEENQNYYITPPTIFMPKDGLRIAFVGTDSTWVDTITDELESTFASIPMTFYHLDETSREEWSWLYLMVDNADLVMVNVSKSTSVELMTVMMELGNKTWFYVDSEEVDNNVQILLNTVNANVFNNSEQLNNMLKAFLGNG